MPTDTLVNTAQDQLTKVKVRFTLRAGMDKVGNRSLDDRYIRLRSHRISHPVVSGLRRSHSITFSKVRLDIPDILKSSFHHSTKFPFHRVSSQNWLLGHDHARLKLLPNGVASSRKLRTWVYLRLRLARTCVHLRWLAMTCAHFGRDQICTQVDASFSPFGHPTQVNASWVTSISLLLANEIEDSLPFKCLFLRLACTCEETCESVWPPNASLYASSTCVHLRLLAGPFDQSLRRLVLRKAICSRINAFASTSLGATKVRAAAISIPGFAEQEKENFSFKREHFMRGFRICRQFDRLWQIYLSDLSQYKHCTNVPRFSQLIFTLVNAWV